MLFLCYLYIYIFTYLYNMNYAYSQKYNYVIGWSAKSGCTYFRQLFLELHKDELDYIPPSNWHNLEKDFPIPKNIDSINKIIICRNPYKRVVSMFTNKYCGPAPIAILQNKFKLDKITFRNFVKKLAYFKIQNKLNCIDHHIKEQTFNFNKKHAYIIRLEEFDENIINIYKSLNLQPLIPNIKNFLNNDTCKNITKKNNETVYVYDKEYDINNTLFPDYKYFYDIELLDLVYKIYENDFIIFNYKKYSF